MTTLVNILAGLMRFVPAHKQADEATVMLSPAKWPIEFVLIANHKGREAFMDTNIIHTILAPAIQATCHPTPKASHFFPPQSIPPSSIAARTGDSRQRFLPPPLPRQ